VEGPVGVPVLAELERPEPQDRFRTRYPAVSAAHRHAPEDRYHPARGNLGFLGQPRLGGRTSGAAGPFRPSQPDDVLPASVLSCEAVVELGQRSGIIRISHADILRDGVT
jgi:hypothetical protein